MNITKKVFVLMLAILLLAPVPETKPITTAGAVGAGFGAAAGAVILGLIIYKGVKHSRCRREGGQACEHHHHRHQAQKEAAADN